MQCSVKSCILSIYICLLKLNFRRKINKYVCHNIFIKIPMLIVVASIGNRHELFHVRAKVSVKAK